MIRGGGRAAAFAAAALLAAGCGGGEAAGGGGGAREAVHRVERGALRITVRDTGTLKAKNSVNIKASIPGTAKIVWLVPEGTEVKEGDKLAELDKTDVQRDIDNFESQVVQFETERKSAKTEFEIQKADGQAAMEKARLEVDIKSMELQRYMENEAPQQAKKRELAVEKARSEYDRRKERYEQMQKLLERGFVTSAQVEEERIAMLAAELERNEAEDQKDTYLRYTADIERRQKESARDEAVRSLENEKLRADNMLDRKKVAWDQAERGYATAVQRLAESRKQFAEMTILAPAPGIVIYADLRGMGGDDLAVGSSVYNEQVFLQLPDLSEMEVTLGIHEADVNKLRVGQEGFVTVDSYPGRRLGAKVAKIATVAGERDWRSDIKKFEVVLSLERNELPLKPGLTVKSEILVGEVPDVLTVPLQAVFVKEGRYFAFVDGGGAPERREVALAESNATHVVVKEGLKEGDRILLWNPEGTEAVAGPAGEGAKGPAAGKGASPASNGGAKPAGGGGAPSGGGGKRGGKP
ncbi:MAG: efflux RND transporter periplasmic adaptor subunit [Planctomycetes bacterium]|nr:efflux RND transporter periplasmic adaptor subunit [Planctomycetota bacterium]